MKNSLYWNSSIPLKVNNKHILRIMKIALISLFIFITGIFATEASSQVAKISISSVNIDIQTVIKEIEEQTDYLFIYDKNEINLNHKVSISAKNKPVANILKEIFKNTDIVYAMQGNNIMLMKKEATGNPIITQNSRKITGTITDEQGEPLIGVNVSVKGTSNGTITDELGHFELTTYPGETIQVSYIGYATRFIKLGKEQTLNIQLKEDTQALEEVVVVGFGTQKKINL